MKLVREGEIDTVKKSLEALPLTTEALGWKEKQMISYIDLKGLTQSRMNSEVNL